MLGGGHTHPRSFAVVPVCIRSPLREGGGKHTQEDKKMKTKYEHKVVKDACTERHRDGGLCRGDLHPLTLPSGRVVYACVGDRCGARYDHEAAMTARAQRNERYEAMQRREEHEIERNMARFTHKPGDHEHNRRVDERIAMNSQASINGVPLMVDGQTGWTAAWNAVMRVVANSTPAPTDMKKE